MELRSLIPTLRPADQRAMATHIAWVAHSVSRPDLAPLTVEELDAIGTVFEPFSVDAGTIIFEPGNDSDASFIVRTGEIELSVTEHGRRAAVGLVRAGASFGDIPMLCGMAEPFYAIAACETTLLRVEHVRLPELFRAHPQAALRWVTNVVQRLEYANRRIMSLTVGDLRHRILAVLAEEIGLDKEQQQIRLTQTELAALLGATRQSVNRVIGGLAREGVVRQRYGVVEIVDEQRLAALAAEAQTR